MQVKSNELLIYNIDTAVIFEPIDNQDSVDIYFKIHYFELCIIVYLMDNLDVAIKYNKFSLNSLSYLER